MPLQEPAALQPDQLIMLAEAAAKAAEHVALLRVLQQQQQPKQQQQPADGSKEAHDGTAVSASCYQPLSEARGATGGPGSSAGMQRAVSHHVRALSPALVTRYQLQEPGNKQHAIAYVQLQRPWVITAEQTCATRGMAYLYSQTALLMPRGLLSAITSCCIFPAAGLDVPALLAGAADALQLLSDTAACCQIVLTRAATAAEPQGLIQAYAR